MLAQYVFSSHPGLFRIVRHGHRWRALLDECEVGRHDAAGAALMVLRKTWPRARLPASLHDWRYLPELALAHSRLPQRWRLAG